MLPRLHLTRLDVKELIENKYRQIFVVLHCDLAEVTKIFSEIVRHLKLQIDASVDPRLIVFQTLLHFLLFLFLH
jgi:hypothetical protein